MKRFISGCLCAAMVAGSIALTGCDDNNGENPNEKPVVGTSVYGMLTDDLINPVGIDDIAPAFSWKVQSDKMGWLQSAYQIVVKQGDSVVWDSGKVEKGISVGVMYEGEALASSTEYQWNVTVWDQDGKETVSDTATFEMGLLEEDAFADVQWISYEEKALYSGEKYTIEFDFVIDNHNQGFCFGMEDTGTFIMWQINTTATPGRVLLRPHFKSGGNWTAYPGGPGNVSAVDVTAAIGESNIVGKTVHERIEVDGKVIKTYFGMDANNMQLANTYTHSKKVSLSNIGFRHSSVDGGEKEVSYYDNIVVKDENGNVLYENNFSNNETQVAGGKFAKVENGMLKVGTTDGVGEQVYYVSSGDALPAFRKTFTPKENLVSAKLYTAGLGVYEAYINGQRIGRKMADGSVEYCELKPGFTEMADRKFYNTYDITWMLEKGKETVLSAVVSPTWWSDQCAGRYGKNDAFLAKLILTYADGSQEVIVTDTSWKTAKVSAVVAVDMYSGESYDARADLSWMKPGFDDSKWGTAVRNREFRGEICAWSGSPITVREDLERAAQSVTIYDGATDANANRFGKINVVATYGNEKFVLQPGQTALIDFGQNFSGWEAFQVEGAAGTTLTIEHGEILNDGNGEKSRGNDGPEGSIYNANYRSAAARTTYILNGNGVESYHPTFSFYGFRYIEIVTDQPVTIHKVVGQVVTSVEKDTGFMETSDQDVNQLVSNIRWGQYSNYLSIPTDCPQRDERQGWTADTQVYSQAGCYMGFSKSFLEKFTMDIRDSQRADGAYPGTTPTGNYGGADWGGTGWADAGIIVPYNLYMMYGDATVIEENWEAMQLYIDGFLAGTNKFGGRPIWGDWLAYESNDGTIQEMLGVAFYAWDALMMAEMADVIGKPEEAERYRALYEVEKEFFQQKYVRSNGQLRRGEQSVCLYALYLDLLPDEESVNAVMNQLVKNIERNGNKLQTGFLGTAIIMPTLTKIGRSDIAYSLLLQHDNPSWLYSVDQGATTIWERWNSYTLQNGFGDVGMNSFNHYAYGAVAAWMFDSMAGIGYDAANPGFKRIVFAPQPDTRLAVKASYDSAYGVISAESAYEGNVWTYTCKLPSNTTGEIRIPVSKVGDCKVNGKKVESLSLEKDGIKLVAHENGVAIFEAISNTFTFVTKLNG